MDITSDTKKKALKGGDETFQIYETMKGKQKDTGVFTNGSNSSPNEYTILKKSFCDYFTPKRNDADKTFRFRQILQREDKIIIAFYTRSRFAASHSEFDNLDKEIRA